MLLSNWNWYTGKGASFKYTVNFLGKIPVEIIKRDRAFFFPSFGQLQDHILHMSLKLPLIDNYLNYKSATLT